MEQMCIAVYSHLWFVCYMVGMSGVHHMLGRYRHSDKPQAGFGFDTCMCGCGVSVCAGFAGR